MNKLIIATIIAFTTLSYSQDKTPPYDLRLICEKEEIKIVLKNLNDLEVNNIYGLMVRTFTNSKIEYSIFGINDSERQPNIVYFKVNEKIEFKFHDMFLSNPIYMELPLSFHKYVSRNDEGEQVFKTVKAKVWKEREPSKQEKLEIDCKLEWFKY